MALIDIEEPTATALRAQANARELSLDAFLKSIVEMTTPINSVPMLALADLERSLDELATESPVLPAAFSRVDIYSDHD